ncbi:MAG: CotH kinase family protein [Planctomycetota bacterium]|nr:CotH kinase family protein [Planctomycetota bacterium]
MNISTRKTFVLWLLVVLVAAATLNAQNRRARKSRMPRFKAVELVKEFDKNGNKRLDGGERVAARDHLVKLRKLGEGSGADGSAAGKSELPARKIAKDSVKSHADKALYDLDVIRTVFLDFELPNWTKELQTFYRTDVEVPATMTVDGKAYKDVGVHYRGSSSYFTLRGAQKTSFAIAMDYVDGKQTLGGYETINLLNGHADPSFMRTVLFAHLAAHYVPIPKACYVHLVINGESWGLYINDQQLNKDFLKEAFDTRKGARWKIPPNFNGESAFYYLGSEQKDYDGKYLLKSAKSKKKAWARLIEFCKLLHDTPADKLESVLPEILDVDRTLWFLAIDNILMDGDGYHYRGSDYALYLDPKGRFCPLFRDNNEAFNYGGGPGGFGQRGATPASGGARRRSPRLSSASLEPLALIEQERAPLVSKVLSVPKWRAQYLANCREVRDTWVDWQKIGPIVEKLRAQIEPLIKLDDKGLYGHEAFLQAIDQGSGRSPGLRKFFTERHEFLRDHKALSKD